MKILVACEYSGIVRKSFSDLGHEAWSCDLLPTEIEGNHYQCDVREVIGKGWDMMVAFPPCTDLAVSGAKWFEEKRKDGRQQAALDFVQFLLNVDIPKIALENPIGVISTYIRKPDQIIHPYMFGHEATKATCLWLKNLPLLIPTNIVDKGKRHVTKGGKSLPDWYNLPPSPDRAKIRSKTFEGIAKAMALQWG